ncbi:MAG: ABC transporter ATP-binding protein [Planctomycetota bacterium]
MTAEASVAEEPSSIEASNIQASTDPSILRTHDLTLRYGRNLAVDGLSLNVHRGEIYGFLGRNGAGKTSTIRMIMGICKPDKGSIEFDGLPLRRIKNAQKRLIGYVSQEQFFYPWMTCSRIGRFVGGLYPTWEADEFSRLMNVLELPPDRKVAHLSGGMRVKLALALALAHRPPILILDEPTAGLDPVARREFLDIIRLQARQHNRTTFFSSHLIDEVERVSDRVGILHRGQLQFEGPLEELHQTVREIPFDEPGTTPTHPSHVTPSTSIETSHPETVAGVEEVVEVEEAYEPEPVIEVKEAFEAEQVVEVSEAFEVDSDAEFSQAVEPARSTDGQPITGIRQTESSLRDQATVAGLRYLRRGMDNRTTLVFQGSVEAWERISASGIEGTKMSLEDAFIALASSDVKQV